MMLHFFDFVGKATPGSKRKNGNKIGVYGASSLMALFHSIVLLKMFRLLSL